MSSKTLCAFDALAARPPATGYPQIDLRNGHVVLDFDDTADELADFVGVAPQSYGSGDLQVVVTWAATSATTGDVVWRASIERHPIADATYGTLDLDTDDFGAATTATGMAPSNAGEIVRTAIGVTAAAAHAPEAGESLRLRIERVATSGSDTLVGDAELLAVELQEV